MQHERVIEQPEKAVASGRITPERRAASVVTAWTTELDAVMGEIRVRAHFTGRASGG
jgi:hypothetical protein